MKQRVIQTAGEIWNVLRNEKQIAMTRLPKLIDEKQPVVYQSLGWLAREDKIQYSRKGNGVMISLNEAEMKF